MDSFGTVSADIIKKISYVELTLANQQGFIGRLKSTLMPAKELESVCIVPLPSGEGRKST